MNTYANALLYAIPGFVVLIILEHFFSVLLRIKVNNTFDLISSLSSGVTNILHSLLGLSVAIMSYDLMLEYFQITTIESTKLSIVLTFLLFDFAGYWKHRIEHKINFLWNNHLIHHSSEEYNLGCALRQSISEVVKFLFFLYIPMALFGIPTETFAIVAPIHLFAQFWYHTRLIDKMGPLEYFIVTPSHHRVHHAINPNYIDKNFSQVFIFWDQLFNTFQKEDKNDPPIYGITKAVNTWNPFIINFQHIWGLMKDAWNTKNWSDKLTLWFKPTGYRPADLRTEIEPLDIHNRKKYSTNPSKPFQYYITLRFFVNITLVYLFIMNFDDFIYLHAIIFVGIIALDIFSYTSLMDKADYSTYLFTVPIIISIYLIYSNWLNPDINQLMWTIFLILVGGLMSIYHLYFKHRG